MLDYVTGYYNLSNRAVENGCCSYRTSDGRRCAIGLFWPEANYKFKPFWDAYRHLPKEVRQMGLDFLQYMQLLHDTPSHWTAEGLSANGAVYAKQIAKKYCE